MKAGEGKRRSTSGLATLDINRLVKAQWSSFEARVKVSVTWYRRGKHVIFVKLQDFLRLLLTEDPVTENFILQIQEEGKVVMWHHKPLSERVECDHVDEKQEPDVTDEAEEQEHSNTDEEYVSCDEEENQSLTEEEYVTDEAEEQQHSNTDEEYVSCDEEECIIPAQEEEESVKCSKLRIHSKRPINLTHLRAVQEDAIEESVEEEAVLSLTLPQEPHVKDAATEAVAKEQNKKQEKRKQCRAKADVGLMFGVMHVHGQDPDAPTEG